MHSKRTTVSADTEDLAILEGEARRRGTSLSAILREAVAQEANRARERTRPRFGVAKGDGSSTRQLAADEDAPARRSGRSA